MRNRLLKKVIAFLATMTFALNVISLLPEEYLNCISASAEGIIVLDAGTTPAEELTIIKTDTTDLMKLELKEIYYKYNTYYSEMDLYIRFNFNKLNMQNEEVYSYAACASLSYSDDGVSYSDANFWGCSEIQPYLGYAEIMGYPLHKTTNLHKYYCYEVGYGYAHNHKISTVKKADFTLFSKIRTMYILHSPYLGFIPMHKMT